MNLYCLDINEKTFILDQLRARITKKIRQTQAQDVLGNIKMGGLMKKAMKLVGRPEEEDEDAI